MHSPMNVKNQSRNLHFHSISETDIPTTLLKYLTPHHDFGFLIHNGSMYVYWSSVEPICTEINPLAMEMDI